ncbi:MULTISPECIES: peptidyl-prolyl cis-trans isomerase [Aquimarina]|uniref:Peptidyl-prolyl cis-trans isomerase n=1 Tax=Aquimarina algiphila TaxID=2047982 RepID=A0A554VFQ2_9FLAO|nr:MULTISPECIES: peptidyl-prolyl cis-trans isomerase [Aquimarina]TSE06061.1 peptidyl-prolyl cis-trans isomerase [Aquimarina algiphila]
MKYYNLILLLLIVVSCQNFKNQIKKEAIARVNETYLYKEDIKTLVPKNTSEADSVNIVNNYINTWATRQLFIDKAKLNLTEEELKEFDDLVESYKSTLYINAYKNAVINKAINMDITNQDLETYYDQNLKNFNLNEELVKLRYLHLPPDYGNIVATQRQLNRFNEEDVEELGGKKNEYLSYSLNDSVWIKLEQVFSKIPVLRKQEKTKFLKEGKYIQLRDSTGVYMVKIKDVLKHNEIAPLEYIKPTIRQIILNRRKLELIKKIEKDITRDAVENKQFEVYD